MTKKIMTTKVLSAAVFAALALSSCSNEVEDIYSPNAPLPEGVTQMVFTFGERGVTPYGTRMTNDQEKDLTGLKAYFLAVNKSTSKSVFIGDASFSSSESNIKFTVSEDYYNNEIKAFLMRGNSGIPSLAVGTEVNEVAFRGAVVTDDLTTGINLPLAGEATFDATGGTHSIPVELTRRVGKVYVKTGTLTGIDASNVSIKQIVLSDTPDRGMYFDDAPATGLQPVSRTFEVNQTLADLTASGDGLAYAYASATGVSTLNVVVSVNGKEFNKDIPFAPTPNHKYALTISVNNSGSNLPSDVTLELTVKDWADEDGGNVDFDTNTNTLINSAFSDATTGVAVRSGKLMIPGVLDETAQLSLTDFIQGYTIDGVNYGVTMDVASDTRAVNNITITVDESAGHFSISAPANYSGTDKNFSLKVEVIDMNDGNTAVKTASMPIVLQSKTLPENFLVTIGGNDWMTINTSGDINKDISIVNTINNVSGADFSEKYVTSLRSNADLHGKAVAGFNAGQKVCPKGFKLPSVDDYKSIIDNKGSGSTNWQYGVQSRDVEETITGTNITVSVNTINPPLKRVATYRKITSGDGNTLFLVAPPANNNTTFGGAHTSSSAQNISLNADVSTKTLFSVTDIYNTSNLISRCVKDTDASVYW